MAINQILFKFFSRNVRDPAKPVGTVLFDVDCASVDNAEKHLSITVSQ